MAKIGYFEKKKHPCLARGKVLVGVDGEKAVKRVSKLDPQNRPILASGENDTF